MSVTPHWSQWPHRKRALDPAGYLYVIEFSLGVVKVGETNTPQARASFHERDVARFGGTMTRWWLSDLHLNYRENEAELIAAGRRLGRLLGGSEYFADCSFDDLVAVAQRLQAASPIERPGDETAETPPHVQARQARVQELRARGLTQRQIAQALQVSLATVCRDLKELGHRLYERPPVAPVAPRPSITARQAQAKEL
ncbi:hypothetical protein [Geodermatophilus sp. SYSU D00710]